MPHRKIKRAGIKTLQKKMTKILKELEMSTLMKLHVKAEMKQEYFKQLIEARIQKHFVSICNQRPGKKLALEIEAGRI